MPEGKSRLGRQGVRLFMKNIWAVCIGWGLLWLAVVSGCGACVEEGATSGGLLTLLERPPAWNEKPFAPSDHSQVHVDPPAFVWLPVEEGAGPYVLAVGRTEDFSDQSDSWQVEVPISVYVPTRSLGEGRWFWRVGLRDKSGQMVWSRTREFTIAAGAKVWPLPEVNRLREQVRAVRPRLLFSPEMVPQLRASVPYTMEDQYERLWADAERAVGEPLPEEPPFVRAQGPARDAEFAKIFRATRPPMDAMETCALAYLLTGQRRFGLEAKRRILHFFRWNPEGSTALTHNPEPAMWMMQRGVRAYDWTWDLFHPEERHQVEAVMKRRAEQFYQRLRALPFESRPFHSHTARDLCFLGEASLAFLHEWPEAGQWLHYVLTLFWSVYPAWAAEDGGWNEGPSYWTAYTDFALHFAVALRNAAGVNLLEKPFFQNTVYYKLYANPPYARHSPFGDAQEYPPDADSGEVMYAFSTLLQNPYARWYAEVLRSGPGRGPLGLLLYDPLLQAKPPSDLPQARYFPGVGLVAMHTRLADPKENIYLLFRSSPLGSISHAHADQNAFVIEAFGQALAIASGYYPHFNSPHHHQWTRQTKAACSITLDGGQGQTVRSIAGAGRILAFTTTAQYDYALGDASTAYGKQLRRFYRHMLHIRPGVFVIVDELAAAKPTRFEWNLHSLERMQIDPQRRQVLVQRGAACMEVAFLAPDRLQFHQTDRFTPPPENAAPNQWHLVVSTPAPQKEVYFLTVLRPFRRAETLPGLEVIREGSLIGVAWTQNGLRHEVLYDPQGIRRADLAGLPSGCRLAALQHQPEKTSLWIPPPCPQRP